MTEILAYINRLKNCGLGKQKSLEFLEKYIEFFTSEKSYDPNSEYDNHCNMDCDNCGDKCSEWKMGYCEGFKKAKEEKPDTVEVVRCKDCKWSDDKFFDELKHSVWCKSHGCLRPEDWFCADGRERKNDRP